MIKITAKRFYNVILHVLRFSEELIRIIWWLQINNKNNKNEKSHILFYHISGLSFGGTEKCLQIIAKHLDKTKHKVFFMYSPKPRPELFGDMPLDKRLDYLCEDPSIQLIPFQYKNLGQRPPHWVRGMTPSLLDVIRKHDIDLLVTAGPGYCEFPINILRRIPVILINIFGFAHDQKNLLRIMCISDLVASRVRSKLTSDKITLNYIPSEGHLPTSIDDGKIFRRQLGVQDNHIVFGRIGRDPDGMFDPIGIRAFQQAVRNSPWIHYIIVGPPAKLYKIVTEEKIPNIHFIPSGISERDVWAFYCAIDVLAHFRRDGECFGLNIAEAMLAGNPIITHRSSLDNAHLEFLDERFAFVADQDNVEQYASFIHLLAQNGSKDKIKSMGALAQKKAESLFRIEGTIKRFEGWIEEAINNK